MFQLNRFSQVADRNAEKANRPEIVDGLPVGSQIEGLVHDQPPVRQWIAQRKSASIGTANGRSSSFGQRGRIVTRTRLSHQPRA